MKLVKLQSQQVPTFLLFRGHRSVVQQCCVRLQSTSNNVAPAHAHYLPHIHTNTYEQENQHGVGDGKRPRVVYSSKDPTCCDLLQAFARAFIGEIRQCNQERTNCKQDLLHALKKLLGALNKLLKTQASDISP